MVKAHGRQRPRKGEGSSRGGTGPEGGRMDLGFFGMAVTTTAPRLLAWEEELMELGFDLKDKQTEDMPN